MKKYIGIFTSILLAGILFGSFAKADDNKPAANKQTDNKQTDNKPITPSLSETQTDFSIKWYKECAQTYSANTPNMIVSSLGIWEMLGSLYLGSDGVTHEQVQNVMGAGVTKTSYTESMSALFKNLREKPDLKFVSGILYAPKINIAPEFKETLGNISPVEFKEIDFASPQAVDTINKWIEERSRGRVLDFFDSIPAETKLIMTNTVVFKGKWEKTFDNTLTLETPFTDINNKETVCPVMRQNQQFRYFKNDQYQWIDLPYNGKNFSMIVVLPAVGVKFNDFEKNLTAADLKNADNNAKETKIELILPKFSSICELQLASLMKKMGLTDVFTPKANFTPMKASNNLMLSQIVQGTFISINEKGTEAIAVTAGKFLPKSKNNTERFNATRPFFYYIKDNHSGSIIFAGRFTIPETKK